MPKVLVSYEGFLGVLRQKLAKKLPKITGVPLDRLSFTVNNWMSPSFKSFVNFLEARGNSEFNNDLEECEIGVKDHKWKEQSNNGRNLVESWSFSSMVFLETICDLWTTVDIRDVVRAPDDKEIALGFKNMLILENGDIVAACPPVNLTYHKTWNGTNSYTEKVVVTMSTVFVANAKGTVPHIPVKPQDVSFESADRDVWPFLPNYKCFKSYVTWRLGRTILEARKVFLQRLKRSNILRADVLEQAEKWAAIACSQIGVATHPHFMNPRVTAAQAGSIVPDAVRIARACKRRLQEVEREKKAGSKRRIADQRKAEKEAAAEERRRVLALNAAPKMSRQEAARHAAWCKKMQGWGYKKAKKRR